MSLDAEFRELVVRRCAEAGLERAEFSRLCRAANWYTPVAQYELQRDDWLERLRAAVARLEQIELERAQKRRAEQIATMFRGGPGAMARLEREALMKLVPPKVRKIADEYEREEGGMLVIGDTGVGKTVFVVAVFTRLLDEYTAEAADRARERGDPHFHGIVPAHFLGWVRAVDLASARAQHALGAGEPPLVTHAKETLLLAIDDLGWESTRDSTVAEVIAERYDRGRPTIVTAGQTFAALAERYSEAVLRRVLESGGITGRVVDLFPKKAGG